MTEPRKRGRPPADRPLDKVRGVRFADDEDRLISAAAEKDGMPVAAWIRSKAVAAAKRSR